jgi:hypothetical protein
MLDELNMYAGFDSPNTSEKGATFGNFWYVIVRIEEHLILQTQICHDSEQRSQVVS